ncbi:double zinc ribbon and ankyrin repeat-containing protein 1 [Sphaeramia orbicularis]|uniref:double zinc ribbon and ankyrin repeat-containing protein 1 n=1 Tax=Sphaeramia orbicularis TaxID=375764 RepID=UPI00117D038D|nr:double zinc ribbon and ankyrin repeat-containing protein 1 [Sphaeramia orbicularis]
MTAGSVAAPLIIPIMHLQMNRAKNHIDTSTPVSIQSETPDVTIYFTLDGSKPAATQRLSADRGKYKEPILLPPGRVSVRAVAMSRDGRASSTVTKVFSVMDLKTQRSIDESSQQHPSGSAGGSTGAGLKLPEQGIVGSPSVLSGPRFLDGHLGCRTEALQSALKQLSVTESTRIQRQTDFLRCAQCLAFRPSDPFARFCPQCGAVVPALPEQRLPPADGGQTLCCVFCNSEVPVNTQRCLICDASISQQLRSQRSLHLQDPVTCASCGHMNPAHVSSCLTCEHRLQTSMMGNSVPSVPSAHGRTLSCSRCTRKNHSDARYCDWCGSKPGHAVRCAKCWRCGATGHPYASYCTTCGIFLEASPSYHSDVIHSVGETANQGSRQKSHGVSLKATHISDPSHSVILVPPTVEQHTQTVGLYYPSATELQAKDQQRAVQLSRQQSTRGCQPPLTAISPGRGYWRKQLDHMCAHLRSYAQNNAPFRALLGEPRLGRLVSAVIQEDCCEVSLTISFVSASSRDKQVDPKGPEDVTPAGEAAGSETLSSVTERSADHLGSGPSTGSMKPNQISKLGVKNSQLLMELGLGRGQISIIQQLLDQGADPSCYSSDGRHALAVAVVNGHHDVLPVLVQYGANVDQQSEPMKNTALHEAAMLGSGGLRSAHVLLSCKASLRRRNAASETPYDVAVTSGCGAMISLLAAQTGQDLLSKLGKPKLNLDVF